jgi:hypothetical protein
VPLLTRTVMLLAAAQLTVLTGAGVAVQLGVPRASASVDTLAAHHVETATAQALSSTLRPERSDPAPPPGATVASRRAPPRSAARAAPQRADPWNGFGFDISWPQCHGQGAVLPPLLGTLAIVGITNGHPLSSNQCLAQQWRWAATRAHHSGYLNLAYPQDGQPAQDFGGATVRDALATAHSAGIRLRGVWLDIEIGNHWSPHPAKNLNVIRDALAAVHAAKVQAGIYTSPLDWQIITGGAPIDVPLWKAVPDGRTLGASCKGAPIGGHPPDLVQAVFRAPDGHLVDGDLQCTSGPDFLRALG